MSMSISDFEQLTNIKTYVNSNVRHYNLMKRKVLGILEASSLASFRVIEITSNYLPNLVAQSLEGFIESWILFFKSPPEPMYLPRPIELSDKVRQANKTVKGET